MDNEKIMKLQELTAKEISLSDVCSVLELKEYEVLGLVSSLRTDGVNILVKKYDDDIYLYNLGEKEKKHKNEIAFETDEENEFRFVAISDTRIGSKSQQLSILNDIYEKAQEMGFNTVIHCGNITEGLYSAKHEYADSLFLSDSQIQVDYITQYYPKFEGIKTYFITGTKDSKHMKNNSINIGRRISNARPDMIYLGQGGVDIKIDNAKMKVLSSVLAKTYTVSYRVQQQIDSFRSEDKPDILLLGGLLQMEKLTHRGVSAMSIPSVCATTEEMEDKRHANTIGAWYVTVKTDKKGNLLSVRAMDSVYYNTDKDDYKNKRFNTGGDKSTKLKPEICGVDNEFINKMYRFMRNKLPIEEFMQKMNITRQELDGILELCRLYDRDVSIVVKDGVEVFYKPQNRQLSKTTKLSKEDLIHTQLCVVSDTHFGNIHQQLHFLNQVYEEAYRRGITTVLHCGDLVDGNYPNRPENPRQQFLHGFDEQIGYVVDMYPKVKGITTKFILGSHDETHYKNDQATAGYWIPKVRPDLIYLGQDSADLKINNIRITMDHPGGGSSSSVSYQLQKRIELLESGNKPRILLTGHYHKSYAFVYRNVRGILVGSCCDETQFQHKKGLLNVVGAYFLDIYSDRNGNIIYFEPEEVLCKSDNFWDEVGKDAKKVKQLVID